MKKGTKGVLIGAGTAAAAAAAVYTAANLAISTILVNEALDRKEPSIFKRRKTAAAYARTEEYKNSRCLSEALAKKNTQRAEITADDGAVLVGHWYPCENAKRAIIAFHGWRSSWHRDFGASSDFWHDNGCSVLYTEQRAHGESGGESMGFGMIERYDCAKWAHWLSEKVGPDLPIYLGGISMGATTVMLAADLPLPSNVHGIIADCGFTSPEAIWKHVVKKRYHIPYRLHRKRVDYLCKRKISCGAASCSTLRSLKNTTIPVLFIHGQADSYVPVEMSYENYKACASLKRIFIVSGAEHGLSYLCDREGYERAVLDFWKEFD